MFKIPLPDHTQHHSRFQNTSLGHPSVNLVCQHTILYAQAKQSLQLEGFAVIDDAQVTLIVDSFHGNALLTLEFQRPQNTIVMTSNPCSEYQADLLEFGAKAVISPVGNNTALFQAILQVAKGETFKTTLPKSSKLTPTERRVLRLLANGLENKEVARALGSCEATVRNHVTRILEKISYTHEDLKLENRTHLALFYWGMWHTLAGYTTIVT
jgi:DNA-binding CsgD family transcriptional regulator